MTDATDRAAPVVQRRGLGIQSKLLAMLLGVSLLSSVIVGLIGYVSGRESLRQAAIDRVTTIRALRVAEIETSMSTLRTGVELDSRNASAVEGATAFIDGFDKLKNATITDAQQAKLESFYSDGFVPALEERAQRDYDPEAFIPATAAGRYLQAWYTAPRAFDDYDAALALNDAGDGSAWSKAGGTWGPYFTGLVDTLGYEDVLIMNRSADVVYSAYKSVDLGVSMHEEPYTQSVLTKAFDEVMRNGSLDQVVITDFERYLPSLNVPTAWVISPIGSATDIEGALAVQVPIQQINAVMTGNERWVEQGLGQTGEVYLAGPDKTMRSMSRLLQEDPEAYRRDVVANGTPVETADRIVAVKGTILLQPVNTFSVNQALAGQTGTSISTSYLGQESITSYSPVNIPGLQWVAVAHIQTAEAFAPVTEFTRNLALSTLAILIGVSLLSLLLAQVFTRPVKRLVGAVQSVAAGDLTVQVPVTSRDEFGDLGVAFNEMASSLRLKQDLIKEQQKENEKLLLTLMPAPVMKRYKEGEEAISEFHDNVSVVYAELIGFDQYAKKLTSEEEVVQLNALMRGFDEAAQKVGVDKVRTLRGGYLASSGMNVPRVDNVRRAVDFATAMRAVVDRFNVQNGTSLDLRAGVDTGAVTSGLVARSSLAYDLWGEAVNLARRVRSAGREPGIYVSQAVRDRLQDTLTFTAAGSVDAENATQTVWKVG